MADQAGRAGMALQRLLVIRWRAGGGMPRLGIPGGEYGALLAPAEEADRAKMPALSEDTEAA
jgi:hypothetical protein